MEVYIPLKGLSTVSQADHNNIMLALIFFLSFLSALKADKFVPSYLHGRLLLLVLSDDNNAN